MAASTPGSFCTYCGQPVNPVAAACTACGADPRVHRKFCYACGVPINEVQVICTKCHTPVGGNAPVVQTPVHVASPVQSVAQPQSDATAKLIIDLPSQFNSFVTTDTSFNVLIDGKTVGKIADGGNIEIPVPTGWVKLEVPKSTGGRLIEPVAMDFSAGEKRKVVLRRKEHYVLRAILILVVGFVLSPFLVFPIVSHIFVGVFGDDINFLICVILIVLVPFLFVLIYLRLVPPYTGKEESISVYGDNYSLTFE